MHPYLSFLTRACARILALITVLAWCAAAGAAEPYAFATTPGMLPKTAVPLHYAVDLTPDLDAAALAES